MTGLRATVCKMFTSQCMLLIGDSPEKCQRCHSRLTTARLRLTPWATGTFAGFSTSCASCKLVNTAHAHACLLSLMHFMHIVQVMQPCGLGTLCTLGAGTSSCCLSARLWLSFASLSVFFACMQVQDVCLHRDRHASARPASGVLVLQARQDMSAR